MKKKTFTATYKDGTAYKWSFYRCPQAGLWFLVDYNGYERALEKNWTDSVAVIHRIVSNHGMTCHIS
jgi:hypothetical protein